MVGCAGRAHRPATPVRNCQSRSWAVAQPFQVRDEALLNAGSLASDSMDAQQTEGRMEIYYPLRRYAATLEELRAVASAAQLNRHRHTSPFG